MPTKGGARNKRIHKRRREDWFAEHPTCIRCGGSNGLKIIWNGEGPKPYRSMTEAFKAADAKRLPILAQCIPLCHSCWLPTQQRNAHGGGKTGVAKCTCELCVQQRLKFYREWSKKTTAQWQERRAKAAEKGLPAPVRRPKWDNNTWNKSDTGKKYANDKRQQLREQWLQGRVCVQCGETQRLSAAWLEYPGPLTSTALIWAYGDEKRAELLEKCHTLCVSCLRINQEKRKREKR